MLVYILPVAPVQSPDVIVLKLQLHIVAVLVKVIVTEGIANVPVHTNSFSYYLLNIKLVILLLLGSTVLSPYDTTKNLCATPEVSPDVIFNTVLVVFATLTTVLLPLT